MFFFLSSFEKRELLMIAYSKMRLGPKIQAEKRNNRVKPIVEINGPLMNSPMSSPAFIKLIKMEN